MAALDRFTAVDEISFPSSPFIRGLEVVDASSVHVPKNLTFPSYSHALQEPAPHIVALAAVASSDGNEREVVGAVLTRLSSSCATILSIAVSSHVRRSGIGRLLLGAGLSQAFTRGARRAEIVYTTRLRDAGALEGLLKDGGWSPPERRMIFGRVDPRAVWRQDWAQRVMAGPPRGATPFAWAMFRPEDRAYIQAECDTGRYPREVSPFWDEGNIVHDLSFGLRGSDGNVVGWLICHTVPQSAGTIRYSRSFSSQASDVRGNGAWLIANALDRHVNGPLLISHPTALFDVVCSNRPMMALYDRRLEAVLDEKYESRSSSLEMLAR